MAIFLSNVIGTELGKLECIKGWRKSGLHRLVLSRRKF
jgi:hypothetical protein